MARLREWVCEGSYQIFKLKLHPIRISKIDATTFFPGGTCFQIRGMDLRSILSGDVASKEGTGDPFPLGGATAPDRFHFERNLQRKSCPPRYFRPTECRPETVDRISALRFSDSGSMKSGLTTCQSRQDLVVVRPMDGAGECFARVLGHRIGLVDRNVHPPYSGRRCEFFRNTGRRGVTAVSINDGNSPSRSCLPNGRSSEPDYGAPTGIGVVWMSDLMPRRCRSRNCLTRSSSSGLLKPWPALVISWSSEGTPAF